MPPKAKDPNGSPAAEKAPKETPTDGIDNYELPRALVTRIAKSSVRARSIDGLCLGLNI